MIFFLGILAIAFLVASGFVAATLIRITRVRWVWTLIGVSALLVAVVHSILLATAPPTVPTQLLYLLASVLLFAGLVGARPLFTAFQTSADRLNAAEKQMEETRRTLDNVLHNAPLVVFTIDNEGIFTLSEGRGLKALGLSPGEVVGQSAFEVYGEYPDILSNLRHALAGED
ncbi:MAG: hypothetical protein KAT30_08500, partial [Candidatus Krumholzibacteria bacterium]|nr:hypothetical protein [Candidatus Krumholzibacteria bacterium]